MLLNFLTFRRIGAVGLLVAAHGAIHAQGVRSDLPSVGQGQVIFFAPSDFDGVTNISIAIGMPSGPPLQGKITRLFKQTIYSKAPACNSPGSFTITLNEGWYQWQAPSNKCIPSLVTEGGAMKVEAGVCLKIALAKLWACGLGETGVKK
jgi:hypothetical protein